MCTDIGGSLPVPKSSNDFRALSNHISDSYSIDDFWLGFNDERQEGNWVDDSTYVAFDLDREWDSREPNNKYRNEHYMMARRKKSEYPYKLFDVDDRQTSETVCITERPRSTGN